MREFWKIIQLSFVIFTTLLLIISSTIYGLSTLLSLIWKVVTTLYNLISCLSSNISWLLYEIFIVHPHLITLVLPILFIIIFIIIFWKEINTKTIIIEPFEVPEELQKYGYSGKAIANQLMDKLNLIKDKIKNDPELSHLIPKKDEIPHPHIPIPEYKNIEIPNTGMNITTLISFMRKLLRKEVSIISGELIITREHKTEITLCARVLGYSAQAMTSNLESIDDILLEMAQELGRKIIPNTIALYKLLNNNRREALDILNNVINNKLEKSDKATAYHIWGYILMMKEGNYEEAIKKYELSEKLNNKDFVLYINWTLALWSLEKYQDSFIKTNQGIDLEEDNYISHINKGVILALLGNSYHAIQEYKKAIDIDPDKYEAYYRWGFVLILLPRNIFECERTEHNIRKLKEAIEKFELAIKLNPSNAMSFFVLGQCFAKIGQIENAKHVFKRFLELNNDINSELIQIAEFFLEQPNTN